MMHSIQITTGELIDRITILKLKVLANPTKNNQDQLSYFSDIWEKISVDEKIKIDDLIYKLFDINKNLWDLEDKVRSTKDNDTFSICAKLIFENNQTRNSIKKDIDKIMKSKFYEEKFYS